MGVPGRGPGTWGQVIVAGAQSAADCVPGRGQLGSRGRCAMLAWLREAPYGFPRFPKPQRVLSKASRMKSWKPSEASQNLERC